MIYASLYVSDESAGTRPTRKEQNTSQKINNKWGFLTKLVRTRWLDIGLVLFFFCELMDRDGVEVHKHAQKD